MLDPRDVGLEAASFEAVRGGDAETNATIIRAILDGERGPRRDVVLLNAAAVLFAADQVTTLIDGIAVAGEFDRLGRRATHAGTTCSRVSHEAAA